MRISEKLDLIDKIGRELQGKYSYSDIDLFLREFKIDLPKNVSANSKWIYSKEALAGIDEDTIIKIADELEIRKFSSNKCGHPKNWENNHKFKLFISHLAKNKDKAIRLKNALSEHQISSFVAHEDIHPTLEWQDEIIKALNTMDAMLTIHTENFKDSNWTQQEIGYALGKGIKIISFKMGEAPTGFISRHQALPWNRRKAEEIAIEINNLLLNDSFTASKLKKIQSEFEANNQIDDIPF